VAHTGTHDWAGGTGTDPHRHDEHQLLYASRGVLSVATDAGVWITAAGRGLWIPAGVVHQHRAYGHTRVHLIGLPAATTPLSTETPAVLAVSTLLRELLIAYASDPTAETPQRTRLRDVLLDQLKTADEKPLRLPTPHDPRLAALLDENPADARSADELATHVGASPRTLSRLCRDELGMTFPQWRTQLRLHHALQLLAEDTPVTAVAHRCGWASASAFIDVFRTTLGHTPGRHHTPTSQPTQR
jgi:AraC-like DNA-binding protein